jgi:4-hydroxy-tetrahydrodipicolinate synthase
MSHISKQLVGTGVALITPFSTNGEVDYEALKRLVDFQVDNGIDYLVILGTTGEPATLSVSEKQKVIAKIIEFNAKRLPLVIGIGGNSTQHVIDEINSINLDDFIAILSVAPYYNKPTQDGIYEHFKAISKATDKAIIMYNVPHRTGVNIHPETLLKLANHCENIIAVKDAASDISQTFELIKKAPKGFNVICGDDGLALTSVLAGGSGVISVLGQGMPLEFTEMINLGLQGDVNAYKIQYKLSDITSLIFEEGNPAGIKTILNLKNICETEVRLPLIKVSDELSKAIKKELNI